MYFCMPSTNPLLWRPLAVAGTALALLGCFGDPVEETVELRFDSDDRLAIHLEVSLHDEGENAAMEARLGDVRRAVLEGYGVWHSRFATLPEPVLDGASWRRAGGALESYERWALVDGPEPALRDFFADVPIEPFFLPATRGGSSELTFYPSAGDRATIGERQLVARELRALGDALADHYRTSHALLRYLEANPDRTRVLFGETPRRHHRRVGRSPSGRAD